MFVAVPPTESVTVTVTENVPDAVGVPDMTPLAALIVKPAGNPVADHAYGVVPPMAERVLLYATFFVPFGNDAVVIEGAALSDSV